jgi:beta-galactosidase/beta-glucuronidase
MGTLLWQLNDVWPGISWSIANMDASPKLAWYAVKRAYAGESADSTSPKHYRLEDPGLEIRSMDEYKICIYAKNEARFVTIIADNPSIRFSDNGFTMKAGETRCIEFKQIEVQSMLPSFSLKSWYDVIRNTTKQ